ncbi:hypothetical protein GCM10017771_90390 [Streptomyces capitiformicae]|uniref:Uncharacterized protein n=1 Tax=Streptomyces capitiformicae TaxID=2014920 RepID=A0A919DQ34_9ACTN|nr:hypothetical protein GCM10017771_90390 [Streptomyces capitiformicae]
MWARRVLAALTAAALLLHLAFPLAPPRMLETAGLVDTGQAYGPTVYLLNAQVVVVALLVAACAVGGLFLLGEGLRGGVAGVLLAVVAARGVVLLTRVPPVEVRPVDENHPVAAVLALEPRHAPMEPPLLPLQPGPPAPGHLTPAP